MNQLQIVSSGNNTLFKTENGEIFGCGASFKHIFSVKDAKMIETTPQNLTSIYKLGKVKQIEGGSDFFLILFECGDLYILRFSYDHSDSHFGPKKLDFFNGKNIEKIYAKSFNIFVIADGEIYAFGDNYFGSLGFNSGQLEVKIPKRLEMKISGEKFKISAGNSHTLFLNNGKVYSCGGNKFGQLGIGDLGVQNIVEIFTFDQMKIQDIFTGFNTSFVLSKEGELFAFGSNSFGQLGIEILCNEDKNIFLPRKVEFFKGKKVKMVSAGSDFTIFILNDGTIYSSGANDYGQLSIGNYKKQSQVQEIKNLPKIVNIYSGPYHTFFLSSGGNLYVSGLNNTQLGLETRKNCILPTEVTFFKENGIYIINSSFYLRELLNISFKNLMNIDIHFQ